MRLKPEEDMGAMKPNDVLGSEIGIHSFYLKISNIVVIILSKITSLKKNLTDLYAENYKTLKQILKNTNK